MSLRNLGRFTYTGWDSYLESSIRGTSSNPNYKTTTTTIAYDAAGHQTEMREHTDGASLDDRIRTFAYDGNDMILARRDGTATSGNAFQQNASDGKAATGVALGHLNQRYVYADGQQVVSMDQGGTLDALSRVTAFSNTEAGNEHVTVQDGDTLRTLAQRVYGNENLWYVIAQANALDSDADLVAGMSLTVPQVKTNRNTVAGGGSNQPAYQSGMKFSDAFTWSAVASQSVRNLGVNAVNKGITQAINMGKASCSSRMADRLTTDLALFNGSWPA